MKRLLLPLLAALALPPAVDVTDNDNEFKKSFDDQYKSCEKKRKNKKSNKPPNKWDCKLTGPQSDCCN